MELGTTHRPIRPLMKSDVAIYTQSLTPSLVKKSMSYVPPIVRTHGKKRQSRPSTNVSSQQLKSTLYRSYMQRKRQEEKK